MPELICRRDLDFLLYEWLAAERLLDAARYAHLDRAMLDAMLDAAQKLAEERFLPFAAKLDAEEPRLVDGRVCVVPELKPALDAYVAGGLLADRWGRRGQTDATLRVGVGASLLAIPCTAALLVVHGLAPMALLLAVAVFLFSMPLGAAVAALHEIVPAAARAQVSAVYLFVLNLVGLGFGPTAVALVTDYVFHDDLAVGYSLLLVCGTALALAALLLRLGLGPYRRSYALQRAAE